MDTLRWLLHSPMPTIVAFISSCLFQFYFSLPSHSASNSGGRDLLAGTFPDLSSITHWLWIATIALLIFYGVIGGYVRSRWR